MSGSDSRVNLVVLGAPGTGKTALTVRFLTKRFIGEYSSRSDQSYKKIANIEGRLVNLTILDTSKYPKETKLYELSLWGHGFLVVFSVTDSNSLLKAQTLLRTLFKYAPGSPYILLANKTDLIHARRVSAHSGLSVAVREGSLYLEVSASGPTLLSPDLAFASIARSVLAISTLRRFPRYFPCLGLVVHFMASWWRKRRRKRSVRLLKISTV